MKHPGIYYIGWSDATKERVLNPRPFQAYVEYQGEIRFIGSYETAQGAERAVDFFDVGHSPDDILRLFSDAINLDCSN